YYLKNNIKKYIKEDEILTEKEINKIIEKVISWTENEVPLNKREVVKRLDSMGIAAERKLPGQENDIADIIKYTYLNFAGWNITDTLNATIGQGQNAYTPIQMAN